MKKLYIIRHAKSSWKDLSLSDFKRPLNQRGKRDAPLMGARLKDNNILADIIYSSTAKRASDTAKIVAEEIVFKDDITFLDDIYEADEDELDEIIKHTDDKHNIAFLIGHNPDLSDLAERYVDFYENIPTSAIVSISFNCEKWYDISPNNAKLIFFDYPKKV